MKRELERIEIPAEHDARERAWAVMQGAFAERQPVERRVRRARPALAVGLAVVLAVLAAAPSSPGRAVIEGIREAVGIDRAQPALFSLPAAGKLLVGSDAGLWVVQEDGSRRLLGGYGEASWSPFGRFVVAVRDNELTALTPNGDVRWSLARPGVRRPRWTGTTTDTRIAYVDRTGIRVVAGDGTNDRLLTAGARGPIAWRPGPEHVLAYASPTAIVVRDVDDGRILWRRGRRAEAATQIAWSSTGTQLLVLSPHHLRVYDGRGHVVDSEDTPKGSRYVDAVFRPASHEVAVARLRGSQSTASVLGGRALFSGTGVFRGLQWSPDGRWLLVTWPTADQWVFVRTAGKRRIRAVANVFEQFRSGSVPTVEGWVP